MRAARPLLVLAALCAPVVITAQTAPVISLGKPAVELAEPMSNVLTAIELKDGRLLLLDDKDKALRLIDLAKGTVADAARQGAGPLEFQPQGLFIGYVGDTTLFFDFMQRRYLVFDGKGKPVRTTGGSADQSPTAILNMLIPRTSDTKGAIYGTGIGMRMGAQGVPDMNRMFADSVSIERYDLKSGRRDTIARVQNPASTVAPKMQMGEGRLKMQFTPPNYAPFDLWSVLPDGRVVALRSGAYQLQIRSLDGRWTKGPVLSYTPVAVTNSEKQAIRDSMKVQLERQKKASEEQMRDAIARAGSNQAAPTLEFELVEPESWPAQKPAYTNLQVAPDGFVWVSQSRPTASKLERFDILDGTGARRAQVTMPAGERVIAFGRGAVYTVRTDEDELQYIRKYVVSFGAPR
jgi:hypothetical protein